MQFRDVKQAGQFRNTYSSVRCCILNSYIGLDRSSSQSHLRRTASPEFLNRSSLRCHSVCVSVTSRCRGRHSIHQIFVFPLVLIHVSRYVAIHTCLSKERKNIALKDTVFVTLAIEIEKVKFGEEEPIVFIHSSRSKRL